MDRLDYFFKQPVTEAELDLGFANAEQADRDIVADLGLTGIISGGVVTEHSPTADLTVDASGPFLSHSPQGERMQYAPNQTVDLSVDNLSASTAVGTPGNAKIVSLFMKFDRTLTDPRLDGASNTIFFDQAESFKFFVVQGAEATSGSEAPPALEADGLLMSDATLIFGQTQIFNADLDTARRQEVSFGRADQISVIDNFVNMSGVTEVQEVLELLDGLVINKDGSIVFTASQSMGGFKLTNLAIATVGTDAVRKTELDLKANDADVIKKDGSVTYTAAQSMGGFKLTNLAIATLGTDAVRKTELDLKANDADVIKKDGSVSWTANQSVGNNKLTNVGAPDIDSTDAARKVDFQNITAGSVDNLLILTSGGAPNTDVLVTADSAVLIDGNGNSVRVTAISNTLKIDDPVGVNSLDTGSEASSTWYFVYIIFNAGTTTIATLFSASATAPTLPSGFTFFRLVGARRNDGSSNLIAATQNGGISLLSDDSSILSTTSTSFVATTALSTTVPPITRLSIVNLVGNFSTTASDVGFVRESGSSAGGHNVLAGQASTDRPTNTITAMTGSDQEIEVRTLGGNFSINVRAAGFILPWLN